MSEYLLWHVGMKVVCVIGGGHRFHKDAAILSEGAVYTIRELHANPATGLLNLLLTEVCNPRRQCLESFGEPRYAASRFRPIQAKKTDISLFTAMLNTTKKVVDA